MENTEDSEQPSSPPQWSDSEEEEADFYNSAFMCVHCQGYFEHEEDLKVHIEQVHKKKEFECSICKKSFYTREISQNTQRMSMRRFENMFVTFATKDFDREQT